MMSPANPHIRIISIGWILYILVPMNESMNRDTLTMKTNVLSLGCPKFSSVMSMSDAAISSPTMAGRNVWNMLCMAFVLQYLSITLLIHIMRMKGSHIMLSEASTAPITAAHTG